MISKKSPKFQVRICYKKRVQTMIRKKLPKKKTYSEKKLPKFQIRNCYKKRVQTIIRKKIS